MLAQEVIRHKRDGQKLTDEEIEFFVKGATDWSVSESQIAAFTMAVFLRGMDLDETVALTRAMTRSGEMLDWSDKGLDGPVVDKHSSGGVGDSVSLVLAPLLAACGGYVPMIAGRGLGHTGGTFDKIESIPGYAAMPSSERLYAVTREAGCAIIGQTGDLAPADKRFYAIRDVSGTVESMPLIASSILSKKLSSGLQALVMDLKCGNGAFMTDLDEARTLARTMTAVAKGAGVRAEALLTDMNQVLGDCVGNALEVAAAVSYLKGERRNPRLHELTMALCGKALILTGLAADDNDARAKLERALDSGEALERFAKMVAGLGGPADFTDKPSEYLPAAAIVRPVFAERTGFVTAMDTRKIGETMIVLGGQRKNFDQRPDYAVGFTDFIKVGEEIPADRPIAVVHAESEDAFAEAEQRLRSAVSIGDERPAAGLIVYETVTA